jgi:hypothetical protein
MSGKGRRSHYSQSPRVVLQRRRSFFNLRRLNYRKCNLTKALLELSLFWIVKSVVLCSVAPVSLLRFPRLAQSGCLRFCLDHPTADASQERYLSATQPVWPVSRTLTAHQASCLDCTSTLVPRGSTAIVGKFVPGPSRKRSVIAVTRNTSAKWASGVPSGPFFYRRSSHRLL